MTINDSDKTTLKRQVAELTEKSKEENYIIKGKLAEKEREDEQTKREFELIKARQKAFEENTSKQVEKLTQVIAELLAREGDTNRDNPEGVKVLNEDVDRAINQTSSYFGDESFVMNKKNHKSFLMR